MSAAVPDDLVGQTSGSEPTRSAVELSLYSFELDLRTALIPHSYAVTSSAPSFTLTSESLTSRLLLPRSSLIAEESNVALFSLESEIVIEPSSSSSNILWGDFVTIALTVGVASSG